MEPGHLAARVDRDQETLTTPREARVNRDGLDWPLRDAGVAVDSHPRPLRRDDPGPECAKVAIPEGLRHLRVEELDRVAELLLGELLHEARGHASLRRLWHDGPRSGIAGYGGGDEIGRAPRHRNCRERGMEDGERGSGKDRRPDAKRSPRPALDRDARRRSPAHPRGR